MILSLSLHIVQTTHTDTQTSLSIDFRIQTFFIATRQAGVKQISVSSEEYRA